MASQFPAQPTLTARIVYVDPPDLVEIETWVSLEHWRAVARAYTSPNSIREAIGRLKSWTSRPEGEVELELGTDTGIGYTGWALLRFYPVDLAGHVVCHIQLATSEYSRRRSEEAWRLSLEMPTEPGLVERFAHQLESIVESVGEEAILLGVLR